MDALFLCFGSSERQANTAPGLSALPIDTAVLHVISDGLTVAAVLTIDLQDGHKLSASRAQFLPPLCFHFGAERKLLKGSAPRSNP